MVSILHMILAMYTTHNHTPHLLNRSVLIHGEVYIVDEQPFDSSLTTDSAACYLIVSIGKIGKLVIKYINRSH